MDNRNTPKHYCSISSFGSTIPFPAPRRGCFNEPAIQRKPDISKSNVPSAKIPREREREGHRDEYKSPFHVATACARRARESACKFQRAVLSRLMESINRAAVTRWKRRKQFYSAAKWASGLKFTFRNEARRRRRRRRRPASSFTSSSREHDRLIRDIHSPLSSGRFIFPFSKRLNTSPRR